MNILENLRSSSLTDLSSEWVGNLFLILILDLNI